MRIFTYINEKVDEVWKACCYTDLVCDVIHNNDTMSTPVVAGRDRSKPLLTCCIPLWKNNKRNIQTSPPFSTLYMIVGFIRAGTICHCVCIKWFYLPHNYWQSPLFELTGGRGRLDLDLHQCKLFEISSRHFYKQMFGGNWTFLTVYIYVIN